MSYKSYLVTGGAGFIGSHLVRKMLSDGVRVTVIDNFSTGRRENLSAHPQLKIIEKDIALCSERDLPDVFDGIAHLAGAPSVHYSWEKPAESHHNNLTATLHVIDLCRKLRIPRMILASSASVYGDSTVLPIGEDGNTTPLSPYGLQKLFSEKYMEIFSLRYGFNAIALRLFNVYGPFQDPKSPYSGVISIFREHIKSGKTLTVYGSGKQTRDYVYVEDVADAFVRSLSLKISGGSFTAVNIANGNGVSLLDLIQTLSEVYPAWPRSIQHAQARPGDILHSVADVGRAHRLLGWTSHHTLLSGLGRMLESDAVSVK